MEYKLQKNEYGDPIGCDRCGCEVPTANYDWGPPFNEKHESEKRPLCEFCAGTLAGNHTRYSSNDQFSMLRQEIWKAAAAVANYLKHGA